jgi:hypothetical protein
MVELYLYSLQRLYGLVLNLVRPEVNLAFIYEEQGWPAFILSMAFWAANMSSEYQSHSTCTVNKTGKYVLHNVVHKISDDVLYTLLSFQARCLWKLKEKLPHFLHLLRKRNMIFDVLKRMN